MARALQTSPGPLARPTPGPGSSARTNTARGPPSQRGAIHARAPAGDAGRDPVALRRQQAVNAVQNLDGLLDGGLGHGQPELVPAQAGAGVASADGAVQCGADGVDGGVAGLVAVQVVDLLQAVEVQQHQGERPLMAAGGCDRAAQGALELLAVGEPGDEVGASV